jgi:hypothetical protein
MNNSGLCLFTSFTTSAFAVERPKDRPSKQELMKAANELEYVFTNIIVQDESTGEYTINEHELNNSAYSEEEKMGMAAFANYMNGNNSMTIYATNAFTRCMSEAVGITGSALKQFMNYVDKKDWVGAAGVLGFFGIAMKPTTIFIFAMTCGATPVSSVSEQIYRG